MLQSDTQNRSQRFLMSLLPKHDGALLGAFSFEVMT